MLFAILFYLIYNSNMLERQPPDGINWTKHPEPLLKGVFEARSFDSASGVITEWQKWLTPRKLNYEDIHPNGATRRRAERISGGPFFEISGRNEVSWGVAFDSAQKPSYIEIIKGFPTVVGAKYIDGNLSAVQLPQIVSIDGPNMDEIFSKKFPEMVMTLYEDYKSTGGNIWGSHFDDGESRKKQLDRLEEQKQRKTALWGQIRTTIVQKIAQATFAKAFSPELQQESTFQAFLEVLGIEALANIPDNFFDLERTERTSVLAAGVSRTAKSRYISNQLEKETQPGYMGTLKINNSGINFTIEKSAKIEADHLNATEGKPYPYAGEEFSWTTTESHLAVVRARTLDPKTTRTIVIKRNIDSQKYNDIASVPHPNGWETLLEEDIISIN